MTSSNDFVKFHDTEQLGKKKTTPDNQPKKLIIKKKTTLIFPLLKIIALNSFKG